MVAKSVVVRRWMAGCPFGDGPVKLVFRGSRSEQKEES